MKGQQGKKPTNIVVSSVPLHWPLCCWWNLPCDGLSKPEKFYLIFLYPLALSLAKSVLLIPFHPFLSVSHTHTHTHSLSLCVKHIDTHPLKYILKHTHQLSFPLSHTHTCSLSLVRKGQATNNFRFLHFCQGKLAYGHTLEKSFDLNSMLSTRCDFFYR